MGSRAETGAVSGPLACGADISDVWHSRVAVVATSGRGQARSARPRPAPRAAAPAGRRASRMPRLRLAPAGGRRWMAAAAPELAGRRWPGDGSRNGWHRRRGTPAPDARLVRPRWRAATRSPRSTLRIQCRGDAASRARAIESGRRVGGVSWGWRRRVRAARASLPPAAARRTGEIREARPASRRSPPPRARSGNRVAPAGGWRPRARLSV